MFDVLVRTSFSLSTHLASLDELSAFIINIWRWVLLGNSMVLEWLHPPQVSGSPFRVRSLNFAVCKNYSFLSSFFDVLSLRFSYSVSTF